MKTLILCQAVLFAALLTVPILGTTLAHPGRTAADGCHYCRTNCDYWGVPWNVRHCHGGLKPDAPNVEKMEGSVLWHTHDGRNHSHQVMEDSKVDVDSKSTGEPKKTG